jgi:glycosyltransferase involved in cell wall biosynthesis
LGEAARHVREGVRCYDMGKGDERDLWMPLKLARVVRRERPDIIHTQSWSGVDGVAAQVITRGPRLVHSEHGRNLPYIHFEPAKRKVVRRCIYHLADVVFTVSEEMRRYYCRETGFPVKRMRVIPNGVDIARLDAADARGVRDELGIGSDEFVIGIVSRINATKDILTLCRAFARLHRAQRAPRLRLLVIGDGEGRAELENFAAEQGLGRAIIFTGVRHDVPRLLRAMDIFALSSLSEGMPVTVLEAMWDFWSSRALTR